MSTAITVKDRAESALAPVEQKFNAVEGVKLAFNKELGFAVQILKNSDFLAGIALNDPAELQAALYNVALTGLSLNPTLRLAYLLPRTVKINGQYVKKICLEPSYMGLIKILTDAGSVRQVWAECVYEADSFEVMLGTQPSIRHIPNYNESRTDDKIIAAYAVAELAGGLRQFEVMSRRQIDGIKARSESVRAKSHSPWDSDFSEMCRKTAIRRIFKYLPKTEVPPQTLNALEIFDANNAIDNDAPPEGKSRLNGIWDAEQKQLPEAAEPEPETVAAEEEIAPKDPFGEWIDEIETWNTAADFNRGIVAVLKLAMPFQNEVRALVSRRRLKLGVKYDSDTQKFYKPEPTPQTKPEKNGVSNFAF